MGSVKTTLTDKNRVGYWIKRKGNAKLSDTKPEVALDEIAKSVGFPCSKPKPVYIDGFDFRPDRLVKDFYVEALGEYHMTALQESKTRKRSRAIVDATGKRLLLIDATLLTDRKYWPYVAEEMKAFASGTEEVKRVWA